MRYVLDNDSLNALISGELAAHARCVVLVPDTRAERVAYFRSDDVGSSWSQSRKAASTISKQTTRG